MPPALRAYPGRLIFDHLPKTAGMAVNDWLRKSLGTGCVTGNLVGKHRELINQYGGTFSVISGHVDFLGEGLDSRYDYATCFRHPVDRAISWLYFVLENHGDQDIVEMRAAVRTFLDSQGEQGGEYVMNSVGNTATEHLCSVFDFKSTDSSQRVEHALSVLERYAFWGLYEQLPEFIGDFAAWLGVPAPVRLAEVNKTVRRPEVRRIAPALRAKIESMNSVDIALYDRLAAGYGEARKRWQRPGVTVSNWKPLEAPPERRFEDPDFALLSVTHEGGRHVNQRAILTFKLDYSVSRSVGAMECGIHIHDERGGLVFGTSSTLANASIGPLQVGSHQITHSFVAALPQGRYSVGFNFSEVTPNGNNELAWFDNMADFQVSIDRQPQCVGYVSLPTVVGHRTIDDRVVRLARDGTGGMAFVERVTQVLEEEAWLQPVTVKNESAEDWASALLSQLHLSYHWLDEQRQIVEFEGVRSTFLDGRLNAGQSSSMLLAVRAPKAPGTYILQALPVQEGHAWFDSLGFAAGEMRVEVVSPNAPRRYDAEDGRLCSQVGKRGDGARVSDGRSGFLVFGPYTTLPAGHWTIRWLGAFDPKDGEIRADVVCTDAAVSLGLAVVSAASSEIVLEVDIPETMQRAEFRLWLDAVAVACLHAIELAPT